MSVNTGNYVDNDTKGICKSLESNIQLFKDIFNNDETLTIRRLQNKSLESAKCCIVYLSGMIDDKIVNENIIKPLLLADLTKDISDDNLLLELRNKILSSNDIKSETNIDNIISALIYGDTLLLLENYSEILVIGSKGWESRSISEPESEKVVYGPKEGFTESIMVNISLIRRRLQTPDLKFKFRKIGERTNTRICISYIEGIASTGILKELEHRLDEIKIDGILDSGYIQELIRDAPFSLFDTVGKSERPDTIASKLLEGRIALIVDGSPFVLTVPYLLMEGFQSSEDYYSNFYFSSINRLFRAIATILSFSIPSIYIAIVTFHQEMLPTPLLLSISASRQGVPFPTALSMYIMLTIFDFLREAGTRIPTPIGQTINIVGTLVLGEAAVEARFVSAPVVIVSAITGIVKFMNPTMLGSSILIRTFLLILTSFLGIYGFLFGMIVVAIHLMSIRSFGVPYTMNLASVKNHNAQDSWIRYPWWSMTLRPKIIGAKNQIRQSTRKKGGK